MESSVHDTLRRNGGRAQDEGNIMAHSIAEHRDLIDETFDPAAMRRQTDAHIALLETSSAAAFDMGTHGAAALDGLSALAASYSEHATAAGWHHRTLVRHHREHNRLAATAGGAAVSLLEVVSVLKRDGVDSAAKLYRHGDRGILSNIKDALTRIANGLKNLWRRFKAILSKIMCKTSL